MIDRQPVEQPTAAELWRRLDVTTTVDARSGHLQHWTSAVVPASALRFVDARGGAREAELLALYHASRLQERSGLLYLLAGDADERADRELAQRAKADLGGEEMVAANSLRLAVARQGLRAGVLTLDEGRVQLRGSLRPYEHLLSSTEAFLVTATALRRSGDPSVLGIVDGEMLDPGVLPTERAQRDRADLLFNAAFFVHVSSDTLTPHSRIGRPYGLAVADGEVQRPPIHRRGAVLQRADGTWTARSVAPSELALVLPGGLEVPLDGTTEHGVAVTVGRDSKPLGLDATAINIVDGHIVGVATTDVPVPQNGMQIRLDGARAASELLDLVMTDTRVRYVWRSGERWRQVVQNGPLLVVDGRPRIDQGVMVDETFGSGGAGNVILPSRFDPDVDSAMAARIGIGVRADGDVVVVAASGVGAKERRHGEPPGVTLRDLAVALTEYGAVDAVNLDGGGSTQVLVGGGQALPVSNRHGLPGVTFERPVPSIGMATLAP